MRTQVVATLVAGLALLGTSSVPDLHAQLPSRSAPSSSAPSTWTASRFPGLGPEAFDVREDGVQREILRVSRAIEPIDIALLVDNSTAASDEIVFLRNRPVVVRQEDVGGESDRRHHAGRSAHHPARLFHDAAALSKSVGSIFPQPTSGMTLLDAIVETSKGSSAARRHPGRSWWRCSRTARSSRSLFQGRDRGPANGPRCRCTRSRSGSSPTTRNARCGKGRCSSTPVPSSRAASASRC
jgi:hypothetical protein